MNDWDRWKSIFVANWGNVFSPAVMREPDQVPRARKPRTEFMIGQGKERGPYWCRGERAGIPYVQRVLSRTFGEVFFVGEYSSVDLAVLANISDKSPGASWGEVWIGGSWTTIALIEHENELERVGIIPTVRKLMDYRSDVLRVAIGYSEECEDNVRSWGWEKVIELAEVEDQSLASLLLVVGHLEGEGVSGWGFFHFDHRRLKTWSKT